MCCSRSSEVYAQNLHNLSVHSMHIAEIVRIVSYTQQTLPVCSQTWNNMTGRKYCKTKRSNKNWIVNYALQHCDMQFDSSLWHKIRSCHTPNAVAHYYYYNYVQTSLHFSLCSQTKPLWLHLNHSKKVKNYTKFYKRKQHCHDCEKLEKWLLLQSIWCNDTKFL